MSSRTHRFASKYYLSRDSFKKQRTRKPGRPPGKKKTRWKIKEGSDGIKYQLSVSANKHQAHLVKRFKERTIPPWDLYIPGKENTPIIRSVVDVTSYAKQPRRIIELLYKAGIILKTRQCNKQHKGQSKACDGKLVMTLDHNAKQSHWLGANGGYYYECQNDGSKPYQCRKSQNNHKRSILYDSIINNSITPTDLLYMIYAYAVVSHTVT